MIENPPHYGGANSPYEAIKVIEAWDLGFRLGNVLKYIARAGKKTSEPLEDLEKALWYLQREIQVCKQAQAQTPESFFPRFPISRRPDGRVVWHHPWRLPPADHTDIRAATPQEQALIEKIISSQTSPMEDIALLEEMLNPPQPKEP